MLIAFTHKTIYNQDDLIKYCVIVCPLSITPSFCPAIRLSCVGGSWVVNVANTVHTVSSQQLSPMAGHLYGQQNCQVKLRRKLLTRSRVSSSTCSANLAFASWTKHSCHRLHISETSYLLAAPCTQYVHHGIRAPES